MCQCGGKHAHCASISFYTHGLYRRQCGGENAKHDVTHTKTNEARKRVALSALAIRTTLHHWLVSWSCVSLPQSWNPVAYVEAGMKGLSYGQIRWTEENSRSDSDFDYELECEMEKKKSNELPTLI